MYITYFPFFLALLSRFVASQEALHPLSDEFIDLINKQGKWEAGRNFHPDTPMSHIKKLMGTKLGDVHHLPQAQYNPKVLKSLPASFDPRDKWPNCPSLNEIRDQGSCGSCYAFGAVEAMTDRVCIYSNGTKQFHFSAEDLVTCGTSVGDCERGGMPNEAWNFWVNNGLVSGGNYNSQQGCRPYSVAACEHHTTGNRPNCTNPNGTPPCVQKCRDGYEVPYQKDKRFGKNVYHVQGEENIKAELFTKGPVEASFLVYSDFVSYKKGVYEHLQGNVLGGHAIKMMGWGEEEGKKYWLIANSWNTDWGKIGGYFKILRGTNECGIEDNVIGGDLAIEDY